jgi:hypothetical protein
MGNGNIVGPPNLPTVTARSGVWTLDEQFLASVAGEWPFLPVPGAGYAAGGDRFGFRDIVDKFAFANDGRTTLATGLSSTRVDMAGFASGEAGYVAGGYTTAGVATVEKFAFSDDSRTTLATGLSSARFRAAGFASPSAGYVAGGGTGDFPNTVQVDTVDKFAFADDSRTTLATGLSSARLGAAGFASANAGYAAGGFTTALVDTVDKFAFSDDSRTTLGTGLSSARVNPAGFASVVAGYVTGSLFIDKFAFPNDTRSTFSVSYNRSQSAGFASVVAGYAAGGGSFSEVVNKINFSNDSETTLATGLSLGRRQLAGFAG